MAKTALIAIGGNSLIRAGERGAIEEQLANARATAHAIAGMVQDGWSVVITHGNGPQVGAALLRSERAAGEVYSHPLDVCVATTQSEIGYLLQRAMESELKARKLDFPVATVLTKVQVDPADPAYTHPTKPIGPFYSKKVAEQKKKELGWNIVEDASRGYRRVVPSPSRCTSTKPASSRRSSRRASSSSRAAAGASPSSSTAATASRAPKR